MKTARIRFSLRLLPFLAVLFAACGQEVAPAPDDDVTVRAEPFMSVPNESNPDTVYLAIRKDALTGPTPRLRNDAVLVFDTSAPRPGSPVTDPPALLAAYPIVDLPSFRQRAGSDQYVLIDPSAR